MISGFARAAQALSDASYAQRAVKCADFVRKELYREDSGILLRSAYIDSATSNVVHRYEECDFENLGIM